MTSSTQGAWQSERKVANWPLTLKLAQETLATTSKNLQVAAYLTEALLQTEKFAGLRQGLDLVYRLLTEFWDTVYPVIDPEDPETREDRATPLSWINLQLDFPLRSTPINNAGHSYILYKESRAVGYEDQAKTDKDKKNARHHDRRRQAAAGDLRQGIQRDAQGLLRPGRERTRCLPRTRGQAGRVLRRKAGE